MNEENLNKGIFYQIQECGIDDYNKLDLKDLEKWLKKAEIERVKHNKKVTKRIKDDMEHLEKRSKELNKPIPTILLIYANSRMTQYVGTKFLEEYKEWL